MAIPIITLFADIIIVLDIPLLREIIVFIFLSFIPGFALLGLFKLKKISYLEIILFSLGLSIAFVMFIGLLVNELYLSLGFSNPLSIIPLTVAISAFSLALFFIECRRDLSKHLKMKISFEDRLQKFFSFVSVQFLLPFLSGIDKLKKVFPFIIVLILLPFLSAIGVLYQNITVILVSDAIVASLCIIGVVSRKLFPQNLFPFLIFSISITLAFQNPLTSKYVTGYDANSEFYVFRLTQLNGHWGFLNANLNQLYVLTYNSMLSITILPAIYSTLMNAKDEMVFKILYPFVLSIVPLTLYQLCQKQFGKLIGILSALFFVFTSTAFFGPEPLSLNRQTIGEFFLLLSVFVLISKTIPVAKRRLLLIVFGAALAVSHYSLAYIYLGIIALIFIISRVKPKFDDALNPMTVAAIFSITLSWYVLANAPLASFYYNFKGMFLDLTTGSMVPQTGSASAMFSVPQVFGAATWINASLLAISNLFLIIGTLVIILKLKGKGISSQFKTILILSAIILVISIIVPSFAASLNFSRFYGITLLFLSPCFVLGGETILTTIGKVLSKMRGPLRKVWIKIGRPLQHQLASTSKNIDFVFLLIAIILGGYFLSQVGFVNRVTGGSIQYYNTNFDKMIKSNEVSVKFGLYSTYIPVQDAFSASWLSNYKTETAEVFCDSFSASHVLASSALLPSDLRIKLTNETVPPQGNFVYLGTLNIVNGVIKTETGSFNTSEISSVLDQNNLVYSNGNSEIWYVAPLH